MLAKIPFTFSFIVSSNDINQLGVYEYIIVSWGSRRRILRSFYKNAGAWGECAFWVGCCTKVKKVLLVLVVGDRENGVGLTW